MQVFTIESRPLCPDEAAQMSAAIRETPNILGYLPRELLTFGPCYVVQTEEGQFAGACVVKKLSARWWEIAAIVVLPAFRKQGIGAALFHQALDDLKQRNVPILCVSCEPSVLRLMERAQMRFVSDTRLPLVVHFAKMRHYSSWYRTREGFRKMPLYHGIGPFKSAVYP